MKGMRVVLLVLVCMLVFTLVGCAKKESQAQETAKEFFPEINEEQQKALDGLIEKNKQEFLLFLSRVESGVGMSTYEVREGEFGEDGIYTLKRISDGSRYRIDVITKDSELREYYTIATVTTCEKKTDSAWECEENPIRKAKTERLVLQGAQNYEVAFDGAGIVLNFGGSCYKVSREFTDSQRICLTRNGILLSRQIGEGSSIVTETLTGYSSSVSDSEFVLPTK